LAQAHPAPEWLQDLALVRARVEARLEDVERVFVVMSGKGGVGKSAVAVNLAVALARSGGRVGLLDADLNSPSLARMLGLRGSPLRVDGEDLLPVAAPSGIRLQSMDFFLQGTQPLEWDGPAGEAAPLRSALEDAALADLLGQTRWGELDALVVDLAPGADRLPALARLSQRLCAIAVTIPSEVSLLAVERSVRRAREARVSMVGLVENMGSVVCERCGHEGALFREATAERLCRELDAPLLARIPFDKALAESADAGRPFLGEASATSPAGRAFLALAERVRAFVPPPPGGEAW
jgi:ATP-binding protein involved in chromosome partitioning